MESKVSIEKAQNLVALFFFLIYDVSHWPFTSLDGGCCITVQQVLTA